MKTNVHFLSYIDKFYLEWYIFRIKFVDKIKTHFVFSTFCPEVRTVYEIMWTDIVERGRPQMTM